MQVRYFISLAYRVKVCHPTRTTVLLYNNAALQCKSSLLRGLFPNLLISH